MKAIPNSEFASLVLAEANRGGSFEPTATYDPDGDCIEFLIKPDPFRAERIDDLVTVYYSQDSKEVVGSLIKSVSSFCDEVLKRMPGFKIEVIDGKVKLVHIFRAKMWSTQQDPEAEPTITYRKLIKAAEESEVEADLCLAN